VIPEKVEVPAAQKPGLDDPAPWNPGPASSTVHNALDLVQWAYQGYTLGVDGKPRPITLAPIVNAPHTWLIGLSGTDFVDYSDTGIPADVLNALNLPSLYRMTLEEVIEKNVPAGDHLILTGHSLGGMVAQNLVGTAVASRNPIDRIITFGSPIVRVWDPNVKYVMFAHPRDVVVNLSPEALLAAFFGHPELTIVPTDLVEPEPFFTHRVYNQNPRLAEWDAAGVRSDGGGGSAFDVGPVLNFSAPSPFK